MDYDYRGCWSFPVETSAGEIVGSFAMYFREPRKPTEFDLRLANALCSTGAIIISHHLATEEKQRLDRELKAALSATRTVGSESVQQ